MNLGRPDLLVLMAIVPIAAVALVVAHRKRSAILHQLMSAEALASLVPPGALRARAAQALLGILAAAFLSAAAARPQIGFEWVQRKGQGLNVVVVLDVSRSMDAQDVSPSRLERARREITDLLGMVHGDSVGLVLVAEQAYLRLPLTTDYGTVQWAVGDSETGTMQAQGTEMAGGIDTATKMLTRASGAGRAIIVVSDGEFHDDPTELDAALGRATAADIRVYSLGVGEASGAPIPLPEGGFKKDSSGAMVLSKLDADQLRHLASATGGAYVQSVVGEDDVRGIYEGEIRAKLKVEEREVKREKIPNEWYQWPLGAALLSLVAGAGFGIGPRERRPPPLPGAGKVLPLLFAALMLASAAPAWAAPRDEGLTAAKAQDWPVAIEKLGQARVEHPEDVEVGQALGTALYRAGRYRESEQVFQALAASDAPHRAVHEYNAGNAAYRDGRLEAAKGHFESAAKADPKLASAGKNGGAVKKEIALREQQEKQDQQGKDGQQGQQGSDGQQQQAQNGQDGQQGQKSQDGQQQQGQPSQDGQQAQTGQQGQQSQDGQQGQQGQQAQDGQQGQPQDGQQQGQEAQNGQQGQDGQQQQGQQAQNGQPQGQQAGGDGQDQADADAAGAGGDLRQDGQTPDAPSKAAMAAAAEGEGDQEGMTPAAAARLVDSVKDGTPQMAVTGRSTEKDW